jgi:hypothetical protein
VEIVEAKLAQAKAQATRAAKPAVSPTLKQIFARGKFSAAARVVREKQSVAAKAKVRLPHPFFDLSDEEKAVKVREMHASGFWGIGDRAIRQLAKRFDVTTGQIVVWLEGS